MADKKYVTYDEVDNNYWRIFNAHMRRFSRSEHACNEDWESLNEYFAEHTDYQVGYDY